MKPTHEIFQLKAQASQVVERLKNLEPEIRSSIEDLLNRAFAHQKQVHRCYAVVNKPIVNNLVTSSVIQRLQQENTALQSLSKIAETANSELLLKQCQQAYSQVHERVCQFITSYQHFLEIYGFSLITSEQNLVLAQDIEGNYVSIPHHKRRTHIFQIGRTGQGKSEMMLSMALQDILSNRKGILGDPFGSMARKVSAFVMSYETIKSDFYQLRESIEAEIYELTEQVPANIKEKLSTNPEWEKLELFKHMCDTDPENIFPEIHVKIIDLSKKAKFNPYKINIFSPTQEISVQDCVALILDTIENVMGQRKQETATAKNVLEALFAMLTVNQGSLIDILDELNSLRSHAGSGSGLHLMKSETLEKLKNSNEAFCHNAEDYLKHLLSFKSGTFLEMINSSRNRISLLVNSRLCHSIFNTRETTLDLKEIINSKEPVPPFIILNCPFEEEGANFVGQYILRLIEHILYNRDEQEKKDSFYIYLDELHRWLGDSTLSAASMADRFTSLRQHGGALTVAMQTASQLKKDDPSGYVFDAIAESCKTKIVFSVGVNDANYFAESIFPNKGNMEKISYTISQGTGQSYSVNASKGITNSVNKSQSTGKSYSEAKSRMLGSTVSNTFNTTLSQTHGNSQSEGQSQGSSSSFSSGISQRASQDITEKTSSMLGVSLQKNTSQARSSSEGTSEQKGNSESSSRSETQTHSTSQTTMVNNGISQGTSVSIGAAQTLNENRSYSSTLQTMSIDEESKYLSQSISNLESRECFVTSGANIKKCVTLDSLLVKLEQQIQPILDDYYAKLYEFQTGDRELAMGRIELKKAIISDKDNENNDIGIEGLF